MKTTTYVFIALACLALTSVHADDAKTNSTEPLFPAQNSPIDCPKFGNCSDNNCHFNGTIGDTANNKHFFSGDDTLITCETLKVDIFYPASKTDYVGNKSYTCFKYDNGNGTSFPVALMNLTKTEDVKGSQVLCTYSGNNCTLITETASQLVLVAGFPNSCVPLSPPTTTPAPVTTTVPTTPTATQSSATNATNATKTEPKTTVSHSTDGTGTTPVAPTQASSVTTAASGKGGKDDSSVARLEFATVLAMAVALFIRHYL